jgi:hypothetical protein
LVMNVSLQLDSFLYNPSMLAPHSYPGHQQLWYESAEFCEQIQNECLSML